MIKLSNSKLILIFTKLLILLVLAKAFSLLIWWYFPSDGVELSVKENYQPKYQRVDFKNMIIKANVKEASIKKQTTDSAISIKNMILKGLYGTESKGFVIVAMKSNPKQTSIVAVGESYQEYILKSIFSKSAKFHKDGSDFILSLEEVTNVSYITKANENTLEAQTTVSRQEIGYYAKNPDKIFKDISLEEVKDAKELVGFKITKIDKNSKFASLGLMKGDVIVKANNVKLKSYADAIQIYKNIDDLDTIQIVVMRDNQEVELVYEIN